MTSIHVYDAEVGTRKSNWKTSESNAF